MDAIDKFILNINKENFQSPIITNDRFWNKIIDRFDMGLNSYKKLSNGHEEENVQSNETIIRSGEDMLDSGDLCGECENENMQFCEGSRCAETYEKYVEEMKDEIRFEKEN